MQSLKKWKDPYHPVSYWQDFTTKTRPCEQAPSSDKWVSPLILVKRRLDRNSDKIQNQSHPRYAILHIKGPELLQGQVAPGLGLGRLAMTDTKRVPKTSREKNGLKNQLENLLPTNLST